MRLHEITNKKERLDEIAPAIVALAPWLANAARVIGPQVYGWVAKHGLKKVASQFGHKLPAVFRKWGPKTPADSSVPDALKGDKVGYGTGQVDPGLATAAKATYRDPDTQPPEQVAKSKPEKQQSLYSKRTQSAFGRPVQGPAGSKQVVEPTPPKQVGGRTGIIRKKQGM